MMISSEMDSGYIKRNQKWVFTIKPSLEDNLTYLSVCQLKMRMLVDQWIKNCFFLLGENLVMWGHRSRSSALAIMLANFPELRALSVMTAETSLCMNKRDSIGGLRITNDGLIQLTNIGLTKHYCGHYIKYLRRSIHALCK